MRLAWSAVVTERSLAATLLNAGDGLVPGLNDDRDAHERHSPAPRQQFPGASYADDRK